MYQCSTSILLCYYIQNRVFCQQKIATIFGKFRLIARKYKPQKYPRQSAGAWLGEEIASLSEDCRIDGQLLVDVDEVGVLDVVPLADLLHSDTEADRDAREDVAADDRVNDEIGRASCRERVCQYV